MSFDPPDTSRGQIFQDTFRKVEADAILFLIQQGFQPESPPRKGERPRPCYWEKGTDFGCRVSVYPKFTSYFMRLEVNIRQESDLLPITSSINIPAEGPEAEWKEALLKGINKAISNGMIIAKVKCSYCGKQMRERKIRAEGPHKGETFMGCRDYPQCRGARFPWNEAPQDDNGKWAFANCPDCGAPLVIRYAKQGQNAGGKFFGCKAYPKCKRIVSDDEITALRLMQGDDARQPWDWQPPPEGETGGIKVNFSL